MAHLIASFQTIEVLKILAHGPKSADRRLWKIDLWKKEFRPVEIFRSIQKKCSGCEKGEFPYLNRERVSRSVTLCGRNAVQIFRSETREIDFRNLAGKLSGAGEVTYNEYLLKASIPPFEITVFANGRAIIQGTQDASQAKSVYAKYIGA